MVGGVTTRWVANEIDGGFPNKTSLHEVMGDSMVTYSICICLGVTYIYIYSGIGKA